jgi:UDP-N-acetylmuramate dehydrogenase
MTSCKSRKIKRAISPKLVNDLRAICSGEVFLDVDLSNLSRWKIGGSADCLVRPNSTEQLAALVKLLKSQSVPYVVFGMTSNLLFSDEGLRAVAIQVGSAMSDINIDGNRVWCQSGVWVPWLARKLACAGLTGAEHICGIPGTLGGLICMNGGSQRKGIGDVVVTVTSVDAQGNIVHRNREDCSFSYRRSIFQVNDEVIADIVLRLEQAVDRRVVRHEILGILGSRRRKFPQKLPNCGSVFMSNPSMYDDYGPPGAVIERLGFKGRRIGGAMVSPLHANFIVNAGNASAADVLSLISEIRDAVLTDTGFALEVEAQFVMTDGRVIPAVGT